MQANSPGAFALSLTLHAVLVAIILMFTLAFHQTVKETPKVFVLVAGEGNNYAATEAPAAGSDGTVSLNVPMPPTPRTPAPVIQTAPPPEPVVQSAPEPPKVVETPTPNFTRDVKRISDKREKRLIEADRRKRAAEEKREREAEARRKAAEEAARKKVSYADFQKQNGPANNASTAAPKGDIKVKSVDVKGVVGGTGSAPGAGGTALTREEGNLWDAYFAMLKQRLHAALDKPPGLSDLLQVTIEFDVSGNGTLSGVRVVRSSGNREFDQAALDAFAAVRSIGATPTGKGAYNRQVTFRMHEDT